MSLFGSLYTGAAGMMAQSKSTAMISQNIANVSSTGYKRSEAFFHDLVTTGANGTWSGPGSVKATKILRAEQQGNIQKTDSKTDAAVAGSGFFAVKKTLNDTEFQYTRNGAFREDSEGYLRNSAGMILHAWGFSNENEIPTGSLASLVPAQIDVQDVQTFATTEAQLAINLNAGEQAIDLHFKGPGQLPATSETSHYTRSMKVYDSRTLGGSITAEDITHDITFDFRHIVGPMAHFSTNIGGRLNYGDNLVGSGSPTPSISDGDTFSIEVIHTEAAIAEGAEDSPAETITFVNSGDDVANLEVTTVKGLVDAIENYGTGDELEAGINEEGRLVVRAKDPSVTINLAGGAPNNPLAGAGTLNIIQDPDSPPDYSFEPDYDITSLLYEGNDEDPAAPSPDPSAYPAQADFPAFANYTNPNPYGWWEMSIMVPDPSDPTGETKIVDRSGLINFNSDGSLNGAPDANGNISLDLASTPVDFDPAIEGDEVAFSLDVSGMSQFSGDYSTLRASQNGAGAGQRSGVEITRDGIIQAVYSNGLRQNIYQIPLAMFTSPNGLDEVSGTSFTESTGSGVVALANPGEEGAGYINPSSLESSNVEISDEFARMIVSQRGYTLSSKVISTIDQMTQRLSEMSR
jgi:flagellar hook protein FlgE